MSFSPCIRLVCEGSNACCLPETSHLPYLPTVHCPSRVGYSSCPRQVLRPYNDSIPSTSLRPTSKTTSAAYFMERSTCNVRQTSKGMTWSGLLTISTRYIAAPPFPTFCSSLRRHSMHSIHPAPLPGSVYANSEPYAAPTRYSQHRTRFRLTL